jgi:hypothetical protein
VAAREEHARTLAVAGHALVVFSRHSGEPFTYLAGSGWSKADMPTVQDWDRYLQLQLEQMEDPLELRWNSR